MSDDLEQEQESAIEALSMGELWEAIEKPRFSDRLRWAFARSAFWRDKLTKAGLTEADLAGDVELASLPFTEKSEILADQTEHPPFGRLCCVPRDNILRIHRTSGTTSRPFYVALTKADVANSHKAGRRAFVCAGVGPGDTIVHCLNYCLWSGGVTDHLCLEATGATVIPFGVGNSKLLLETILRLEATAISCTPTYLNTLAELLEREFHRAPRELGLKKGLFGGEPGLEDPNTRKALESRWGIQAINANYGASEILSIFGSECSQRNGLHWHGQGILHAELIDPATLRTVPLVDGATGELVFTSLLREAQPVFRFRSRDMVKVVGVEQCGCGRRGFRFTVLGRSDNMLIIKGVNLFPDALYDIIMRYADRLTGEYRVVLKSPGPYDHLDVRVEIRATLLESERESLKAELERAVRESLSVKVDIEWVPSGTFPRGEDKTSRIDRRFQ
jgi:phenylacetate-CoA ligase